MKKTAFTFGLGLLIGMSLMHFFKKQPVPPVVKMDPEVEVPSIDVKAESAPPKKVAEPIKIEKQKIPPLNEAKVTTQNRIESSVENAPVEENTAKSLDFHFNEAEIAALEQQLPDLQKEVSLYRTENGWVVRVHHEMNPFSSIGIKDNDFIRYNQFEELENDPTKKALASRLVDILTSLER